MKGPPAEDSAGWGWGPLVVSMVLDADKIVVSGDGFKYGRKERVVYGAANGSGA